MPLAWSLLHPSEKMKMKRVLIVLVLAFSALGAQTHRPRWLVKSFDAPGDPPLFVLQKKASQHTVRRHHQVTVQFTRTARLNDGRSYQVLCNVKGTVKAIQSDSLHLLSPQVAIHDPYKRNTDSIYDYFKNTSNGVAKVPLGSITRLRYERAQLKRVCAGVAALSLLAAFVVAPAVSMEEGRLNLEQFRAINRPALGVLAGALAVGVVFSHKRFQLRASRPAAPVWQLQPQPPSITTP